MEKHRPEDDLFKKILENHPDFNPSKSDINDMKSRLDSAENSNRKNGFGFWWLPILLLPFIFTTGFLFFKNQKLDHQVQVLNSKLSSIQNDTFHQNYITYHFDTIYNTKYIDRVIERKSTNNYQSQKTFTQSFLNDDFRYLNLNSSNDFFNLKNQNTTQKPFIYGNSNTFTFLQLSNSIKEKNLNNDNPNIQQDRLKNAISASQNPLSIPPLLVFLNKNKNENVLLENIHSTFEFQKKRRKLMRHFSPKGFRIGLVGSPFSFTEVYSSDFKLTNSIGIEGEIDFNHHVKLLLGIRSMNLNFEEKNPDLMVLYPSIMPNDPTDKLRELYVTTNQIQIPIMIKYLFSTDKKWQPFISFGFVANRPYRQKFKHKLINTSLEEYEILQNFREGVFSIKNFEGAFGFETNLTTKISGSASLNYLHDFELGVGEYFLWRNAGLNISLKYKL